MRISILLCVVSLALTQAATFESKVGDCDCACECPDPTEPPCPTDCVPLSKCENFNDESSDFSMNCGPRLSQKIIDKMYEDCLMWEAVGEDALDNFCENVKLVCTMKDGTFEFEEVPCPPESTTVAPPTTTCQPESKCENLNDPNSSFGQNCAPNLVQRLIDQMYTDCLMWEAVGGALFDDFCVNIELICQTKEGDFEWEEGECPTTPMMTTTCEPASKCDNLKDSSSSFGQNCAPKLDQMMIDKMYMDCLKWEAVGGSAFDDFCDNINLVCEIKDGDFEWEIEECPTDMPTTTVSTHEETFDCVCNCMCPWIMPVCTTTTDNPTTTCVSPDPCDVLKEEPFTSVCGVNLDPKITDKMYEDCVNFGNDMDAILNLFANIETVCKVKDSEIELVLPEPCP